jgi:hypothetical protein
MKKTIQRFWLMAFFLLLTLALLAWAWIGLQNLLVVLHALAR